MPLSRQQYVCGIISAVRESHGPHARAAISRQIAEYRDSGECELADIWAEAYQAVSQQEADLSRLAELGYVSEAPPPA
jgi:hypothetical protein